MGINRQIERCRQGMTDANDRRALWRVAILGAVALFLILLLLPAAAEAKQIVGSRPAGCPRAFCGCALSLKLFGTIRPILNLAANWPRLFPRTSPAPGMVAARRGHVMKLQRHVRGTRWIVWTANSCGRRICIRERSIAGFVVVNPRGAS